MHRFHEEHGPDWATLAKILGKHRIHVKDTWRRVKLPAAKSGMLISCYFLSSFIYQKFLDIPKKIYNYVYLHKFRNFVYIPLTPGFLSLYIYIYIYIYIPCCQRRIYIFFKRCYSLLRSFLRIINFTWLYFFWRGYMNTSSFLCCHKMLIASFSFFLFLVIVVPWIVDWKFLFSLHSILCIHLWQEVSSYLKIVMTCGNSPVNVFMLRPWPSLGFSQINSYSIKNYIIKNIYIYISTVWILCLLQINIVKIYSLPPSFLHIYIV